MWPKWGVKFPNVQCVDTCQSLQKVTLEGDEGGRKQIVNTGGGKQLLRTETGSQVDQDAKQAGDGNKTEL